MPANVVKKSGAFAAGMAVAEGLVLGAYRYEPPRQQKAEKRSAQKFAVAAVGLSAGDDREFARGLKLGALSAQGTVFARDLENQAPNHLTPTSMARHAKRLADPGDVRIIILENECRCAGRDLQAFDTR